MNFTTAELLVINNVVDKVLGIITEATAKDFQPFGADSTGNLSVLVREVANRL